MQNTYDQQIVLSSAWGYNYDSSCTFRLAHVGRLSSIALALAGFASPYFTHVCHAVIACHNRSSLVITGDDIPQYTHVRRTSLYQSRLVPVDVIVIATDCSARIQLSRRPSASVQQRQSL